MESSRLRSERACNSTGTHWNILVFEGGTGWPLGLVMYGWRYVRGDIRHATCMSRRVVISPYRTSPYRTSLLTMAPTQIISSFYCFQPFRYYTTYSPLVTSKLLLNNLTRYFRTLFSSNTYSQSLSSATSLFYGPFTIVFRASRFPCPVQKIHIALQKTHNSDIRASCMTAVPRRHRKSLIKPPPTVLGADVVVSLTIGLSDTHTKCHFQAPT